MGDVCVYENALTKEAEAQRYRLQLQVRFIPLKINNSQTRYTYLLMTCACLMGTMTLLMGSTARPAPGRSGKICISEWIREKEKHKYLREGNFLETERKEELAFETTCTKNCEYNA